MNLEKKIHLIDEEDYSPPVLQWSVYRSGSPKSQLSETTTSGIILSIPDVETPTADVEKKLERMIDERDELLFEFFLSELEKIKKKNELIFTRFNTQSKELFAIRKELNLHRIDKIALLEKNWSGEGADIINKKIIAKVRTLILSPNLKVQPQIFPTRRGTILFEYQDSNEKFVEIEIYEDKYEVYGKIESKEIEFETKEFNNIINIIDEFRSK